MDLTFFFKTHSIPDSIQEKDIEESLPKMSASEKQWLLINYKLPIDILTRHALEFPLYALMETQTLNDEIVKIIFPHLDSPFMIKTLLVTQQISLQLLNEIYSKDILSLILRYQDVREDFIEMHVEDMTFNDWATIVKYRNVSEVFLDEHFDKLPLHTLLIYRNVSDSFILSHFDSFKPSVLCYSPNMSFELMKEKLDAFVPEDVIRNYILDEEIMQYYIRMNDKSIVKSLLTYQCIPQHLLHFIIEMNDKDGQLLELLLTYQVIDIPMIESLWDRILSAKNALSSNIKYIAEYQALNDEFVEKHFKLLKSCIGLYQNQNLSNEFYRKHLNEIDPIFYKTIIKYNNLSLDILETILQKDPHLNDDIATYQNVPQSFLKSHHTEIPSDSWRLKDTAFKKNAIMKIGVYECHDDYFIAYKAIRPNRYSIFSSGYHYEKGHTYTSTCDYTNEYCSFGLSAGTLEYAKKYGGKLAIVVKCKIAYKDVGRVFSDRVRCTAIEILD